jgi:two-component system sensor histidine kinase/response regulator
LVLLDISLPELDGGEVLRRIRADAVLRHLPVIALTAHAMAGDREKYLAAGFNDYVSKPIVEEQVLLDAIRKQLPDESAANGPGTSASHPLEEAAIDRLRRLGGDEFAGNMINLFLEYSQTKLVDAQKASQAEDCAGVAKAAHPIKSSAGNVGANRVQELAASLEEAATAQQLGEMDRLLGQLAAALAEVKPRLELEKKKCDRAA